MIRKEKEDKRIEWENKLRRAQGIYITNFKGLDVAQMEDLRRRCDRESIEYKVIQNRIVKFAAMGAGIEKLVNYLKGPVGLALSYSDPAAPAKVLKEFAKGNTNFKILGALVEDRDLTADYIDELAALPPKDLLVAKFIADLKSPISNFTMYLSGILKKFVYLLNQIGEKKGGKDASEGKEEC